MFIVRTDGSRPVDPSIRIVETRATPEMVAESSDQTDLFCVGDDDAPDRLREAGWTVVLLRDGWYQGDGAGGVAIWGQGLYWEVRDTPFSVGEAVGPSLEATTNGQDGDLVDVRRGIFGV